MAEVLTKLKANVNGEVVDAQICYQNCVVNKPTFKTINGQSITGEGAFSLASSTHTHNNATSSAAGFMSADDKIKLGGISTGANKVTFLYIDGVLTISED